MQDLWEWEKITVESLAIPPARDFACLIALPGGRLLLHGGLDTQERRLDDTWIFHITT